MAYIESAINFWADY